MWSRIIAGYVRRIYKVFIWLLLATACFSLVCYLSYVPVSVGLYAALLAAFAGTLFLAVDFIHFAVNFQKLELLLGQEDPVITEFPRALDGLESAYQELLQKVYENRLEEKQLAMRTREDLIDYYTLWVHQIKTPIAALHLLLQTEESPNAGVMAMELFKIEQYTDMVLQYLRLGSPVNDFVLQDYNLDDIIRQALRKYARMFIGQKIAVEFRETHMQVLTDEKWLLFVIEQLLSNALKYTNSGAVKIYTEDGKNLVVEDTGIGISPEDLPRIFEKGYTGFNGRMDKKATGLGLYLCKQICGRLSHPIAAASEPGKGTRITLHFQE